jgi:hypothetical protein
MPVLVAGVGAPGPPPLSFGMDLAQLLQGRQNHFRNVHLCNHDFRYTLHIHQPVPAPSCTVAPGSATRTPVSVTLDTKLSKLRLRA